MLFRSWVRVRAYQLGWWAALAMGLVMAAVSLWTPFLDAKFMVRWFSVPSLYYTALVPVLTFGLFVGLFVSLNAKQDDWPFLFSVGLFVTSYIGLGISMFPLIVPPHITIWQAAAPDSSLAFLLVGAVVLLPIILGYTAYSYWVFRGKTKAGEGYH